MSRTHYSRIIEERLIARYKKEFFEKTGKILKIEDYQVEGIPLISLNELEDILNEYLPEKYTSIKDDTRVKEVVYPRMLFCNLAHLMNYPIIRIAEHIDRDRTTVYAAIEKIDMLMSANDLMVTTMYNDVKTKIINSNGPTIPTMSEVSDYPESVISSVLLQTEDQAAFH